MSWFSFCWHKYPLYGTDVTKQEFVGDDEYVAWFTCFKCKKSTLKNCDRYGMRR